MYKIILKRAWKMAQNGKNVIIVGLVAVVFYMAGALVRIENERYALIVNMCQNKVNPALPRDLECLKTVETRTHWLWHLFYALQP